MKKVISLLLALIMIFTTASAYSNDNDNISVAHAQVYHASGVNEYGTNILEKSEIEHDVPAKIITQNGCITIDMILDGNPIVISARLEGRNLSDNLLYYDAECISDGNIDVMSFTYNKDFTPKAAITSDYNKQYPAAKDVLKVYLKVNTSTIRIIYFIKKLNFLLEDFDSIISNAPYCDIDYWSMREFKPINSGIIEKDIITRGTGVVGSYIIYDYYDILNVEYMAKMDVEVYDSTGNIPLNGELSWSHRLSITDKSTVCPSVSDYESDDCYLLIDSATLKVGAPKGTAYVSSTVDGSVTEDNGAEKYTSVSIGTGVGPLSVSFDLSGVFQHKGSVDLNESFTGYKNIAPNNYTTAIQLSYGEEDCLQTVGDYYESVSLLQDYGHSTTSPSPVSRIWEITVSNTLMNEDHNRTFSKSFDRGVSK